MYTDKQYAKLAKWLGHTIKYHGMLGYYVFLKPNDSTGDSLSWYEYINYLASEKGRCEIEDTIIENDVDPIFEFKTIFKNNNEVQQQIRTENGTLMGEGLTLGLAWLDFGMNIILEKKIIKGILK